MDQLFFQLQPSRPWGLEHFVAHSGVLDALSLGRALIDRLSAGKQHFAELVVSGPSGVGKSHLLHGLRYLAESEGISEASIDICNAHIESGQEEAFVAAFVRRYDRRKADGGLLLVEIPQSGLVRELPESLSQHLWSRLRAGATATMDYPRQVELGLIVRSLIERRNLKLPQSTIQYLVDRLPGDPFAFDRILKEIDEIALSTKRQVNRRLIGEVLREPAPARKQA